MLSFGYCARSAVRCDATDLSSRFCAATSPISNFDRHHGTVCTNTNGLSDDLPQKKPWSTAQGGPQEDLEVVGVLNEHL